MQETGGSIRYSRCVSNQGHCGSLLTQLSKDLASLTARDFLRRMVDPGPSTLY